MKDKKGEGKGANLQCKVIPRNGGGMGKNQVGGISKATAVSHQGAPGQNLSTG